MTYSSSGSGHGSTTGVILGVLFGIGTLLSIAFLWWYCCWRPRTTTTHVVYAQPGEVAYVQYQPGYLPAPPPGQNPAYREVEYESRIFAPAPQYAPVYPSNPGAGVVYAQPMNRY